MGTLFFYAPEYMNGFKSYCKRGPCLDFTPYNLFYYWFGFWFMNILWIVVPYLELRKAWNNINNQINSVQQVKLESSKESKKKK
jgi:hypothetical protein